MTRNKQRIARRRKNLRKRIAYLTPRLRLRRGARPYYEAFDVKISPCGRLVSWRERKTKHLDDVYGQLIALCGDMTVELPPELFAAKETI